MPANAFTGRRIAVSIVLVLLVGATVSVLLAQSPTTAVSASPVPASVIPRLRADAARMAVANGDARPTWVKVVRTTYGAALQATSGDSARGAQRQPVYLLVMHGRFVAKDASIQAGGRIPTGTYAEVVLRAGSLFATDSGLGDRAVALSRLGTVTVLSRRS